MGYYGIIIIIIIYYYYLIQLVSCTTSTSEDYYYNASAAASDVNPIPGAHVPYPWILRQPQPINASLDFELGLRLVYSIVSIPDRPFIICARCNQMYAYAVYVVESNTMGHSIRSRMGSIILYSSIISDLFN
jgi:hypothetical protein